MENVTEKPLLIFDYDGTLHETFKIYEPAFRMGYKELVDNHILEEKYVSSETVASWLGTNLEEMWGSFAPELTVEQRDHASDLVAMHLLDMVLAGDAIWYEGVEEALTRLKEEGYTMVILSNCRISYRDSHWKCFNMGRWFDRFYDCETYNNIPKTEIIKSVLADYNTDKCIMIGDRAGDMAAGRAVGGGFIGCLYGYGAEGELDGADVLVNDISELPEAVKM